MDEHAVALDYLQQALNIYEKSYCKDHEDVKKVLAEIGLVETALQNRNRNTHTESAPALIDINK